MLLFIGGPEILVILLLLSSSLDQEDSETKGLGKAMQK